MWFVSGCCSTNLNVLCCRASVSRIIPPKTKTTFNTIQSWSCRHSVSSWRSWGHMNTWIHHFPFIQWPFSLPSWHRSASRCRHMLLCEAAAANTLTGNLLLRDGRSPPQTEHWTVTMNSLLQPHDYNLITVNRLQGKTTVTGLKGTRLVLIL